MAALPFKLMLITDWSVGDLLDRVDALAKNVPQLAIQHRHPEADDRQFLEEARALAGVCAPHNVPLFVNRRLDIARLVNAHLHLPSSAVRAADVRPHLSGRYVSVAVHSAEEVQAGADLALVSPVFPPGSKPHDERPPLGVDGFRQLAAQLTCPAFALGGIDAGRVSSLSGAAGVAVISGLLRVAQPVEVAGQMLTSLSRG